MRKGEFHCLFLQIQKVLKPSHYLFRREAVKRENGPYHKSYDQSIRVMVHKSYDQQRHRDTMSDYQQSIAINNSKQRRPGVWRRVVWTGDLLTPTPPTAATDPTAACCYCYCWCWYLHRAWWSRGNRTVDNEISWKTFTWSYYCFMFSTKRREDPKIVVS